jgi:hypothetical protein
LSRLGSCSAFQSVAQGNDVSAVHWQQDQLLVMPECRGPTLQAPAAAQSNTPQLTCQQQDLVLLQLQQEFEAASAAAAAVLRQAQARLAAEQVQGAPVPGSQHLVQCPSGITGNSLVGAAGLAAGTSDSAALMAFGQLDSTILQQRQQLQELQQQLQQLLLPGCVGSGALPVQQQLDYAGGTPAQLVAPLAVVTTGRATGPCLADTPSLCSSSLATAAMFPMQGSSTPLAPVLTYSNSGGHQVVMGNNNVAAVAAAAAAAGGGGAQSTPAQAQQLVAMQVPLGR